MRFIKKEPRQDNSITVVPEPSPSKEKEKVRGRVRDEVGEEGREEERVGKKENLQNSSPGTNL